MGNNASCMKAIQGSEVMGFNHMAGVVIAGKVSVSVATNGNLTVCGFASNAPNDVVESKLIDGYGVNWEKLDQVSLARCEKNKAKSAPQITTPCRIYSHNYDIIYGKEAEDAK